MDRGKLIIWSLIVALGGFRFGFGTAAISGTKKSIQKYWPLSSFEHGFTISVALTGTIFGALFRNIASDQFGPRQILFFVALLYVLPSPGIATFLLSATGAGLINFIFTLPAIRFIDKTGRKILMLIGSFGLVVSLAMVSRAFLPQDFSGYIIMIGLLLFIGFFAFSQGTVIRVFMAAIFPSQVRAKGQAPGSITHWMMAAAIIFIFPSVTGNLEAALPFYSLRE